MDSQHCRSCNRISWCFSAQPWTDFAAPGRSFHRVVRDYFKSVLIRDGPFPAVLELNKDLQHAALVPLYQCKLHLPLHINDYTDFYADDKSSHFSIRLSSSIATASGQRTEISSTSAKNLLFSFPQMLAHHSIGGCPFNTGNLPDSGTTSGEADTEKDGDIITISGTCDDEVRTTSNLSITLFTTTPLHHPRGNLYRSSPRSIGRKRGNRRIACCISKSRSAGFSVSSDLFNPTVSPCRMENFLENMSQPSTETHGIVALLLSTQFLPVFFIVVAFVVSRLLDGTDIPEIKGIPQAPGVPVFGSLFHLGTKHAKVAQRWSKRYGPVFQVRMGNRRIVFANTFESVKNLWITNQSALISRPKLHTFHTVVSSSEGFTIGTSPWDESCKARRKAAATALNRPAVQSYMPTIDYEATKSIKEMLLDSKYGEIDLDPNAYFTRYALSTSLMLNYGIKIEGNVNDAMLTEIIQVERMVSNFRSTSNNWADYVPLLRLLPGGTSGPREYRQRRAVYMHKLLNMLKERIADGTDRPCITGNVLKDPEAKLNDGLYLHIFDQTFFFRLTNDLTAEVMSICLTMVSAGLDTVPGNLIMCIAYLSCPRGADIQARALCEIDAVYPDRDSWERCLHEEKVPYITALVKETLRFWSVIPICLPRTSTRPIHWNNAVIPAGTSFYMNAYGAHYDETHFRSAYDFLPERYLADDSVDDASASRGTPHYGYGAGSRMCIGSHLANRELYTAFLRLITAFEIVPPRASSDQPILDALECNQYPTSLTMDPKPFKVGLKVRDRALVDRWIAESEARTRHL
nr:phenylacetate 2-hydroxylase [Quercus suber]